MTEFFGVPQPIRQPQRDPMREDQCVVLEEDVTINQNPQLNRRNHRVEIEQPRVEIPRLPPQIPKDGDQGVMVVNRNQNADELIQQVRNHNYGTENNLTAMIERILI